MKTLYTIVILMLIGTLAFAQTPEAFKYQAVIGNASGEAIANSTVALRVSVLRDSDIGAAVYEETFHPVTNAQGLVDIELGNGSFYSIDWGAHNYFLKIEVDPDNGTNFIHLGTSQLLSVPYALNARSVETDLVNDADADPVNELQTISLDGLDLTLSEGGGTVALPSGGDADNWGSQVVERDATLSGDGTSGDPLSVVGDLTDDQTLSISEFGLSITDGNTVVLPTYPWYMNGDNTYFSLGNVGINESSPEQPLHVNGSARFDLNGGSINLTTPVGVLGLVAYESTGGHRRDIRFDDWGIGIFASTSEASPDFTDGLWVRPGGHVGIQSAWPGDYPLLVNEIDVYGLAIRRETSADVWELYVADDGNMALYHDGGNVGWFDGTSGVYTPISDRRAKSAIQPLKSTLGDVKEIKPSTYDMKVNSRGKREIGLVAQDLQKHFPELVYEREDEKTGKTVYTVNYNGIAVVAVKAIQEQQEVIEDQSARIDDLERKLERLEARLNRF